MKRFLFQYLELCSVIGAGTPENPGGDFDMNCWIEAPDREAALQWGYVLLGNYCQMRYAHSANRYRCDGSPVRRGEIIEDPETIADADSWNIPSCRVGEVPEWHEPWRFSNIRR
jgi:hypothetical protein